MDIDGFYDYLVKNDAQIRNELRKNITYDSELFEDVYAETVIRVVEAIEKGKDIGDIRMYFFIAFKFNYIQAQNKMRRNAGNTLPLYEVADMVDDDHYDREERSRRINKVIDRMTERLELSGFDGFEIDLFIIYFRLKCGKTKISYRKLSEITGIQMSRVVQIIQSIKRWIKDDKEINDYKKKILSDD